MAGEVLLGRAAQDTLTLFVSDLPYVLSLPVTFLLSAILLAYFFGQESWRRLYARLFLFLANFALWMLGSSNFLEAALAEDRPLFLLFSGAMLYLLPVTANLVVAEVMEQPAKKKTLYVVCFYAVLFVLAFFAEIGGGQGFLYTRALYYISLPVSEGFVFVLLRASARGGNRYSRAMLLPLCTLTLLGLLDGANAFFHLTRLPVYIMPLGVLSFLYFILQLLRDQMLREKSLADDAAVLEYRAALAHEQASTDELTLCRNRAAFERELRQTILSVRQSGQPLTCLLLDVDHFKKFNDTYGHEAGDAVLRQFARTVRETLDKTKPFYRWGGEEFIVLTGLELDDAAVLAGEICQRVAGRVAYAEQPVTASIGVSIWHGALDTADRFFARADEALYRAKAAGRDTFRVEQPAALGQQDGKGGDKA